MATHRLSFFGAGTTPDATSRAWFEPARVALTNDLLGGLIARFADPTTGQAHGFYGQFPIPKNYVGTAKVILRCKANATTGNVRMRFSYRAVAVSEGGDQSTWQEQVSVTTAVPSTAWNEFEISFTLTSANLAVDDELYFLLERLDDSGTDTLAADLIVTDWIFEYADA